MTAETTRERLVRRRLFALRSKIGADRRHKETSTTLTTTTQQQHQGAGLESFHKNRIKERRDSDADGVCCIYNTSRLVALEIRIGKSRAGR